MPKVHIRSDFSSIDYTKSCAIKITDISDNSIAAPVDQERYLEISKREKDCLQELKQLFSFSHGERIKDCDITFGGFTQHKKNAKVRETVMVMPLYQGHSLGKIPSSINDFQFLKIAANLCQKIQHIHDKGIIHADIKPDNIICDQKGTVNIVDFGRNERLDEAKSIVYSESRSDPAYMAPECVVTSQEESKRNSGGYKYSKASDTWSAGKVLRELYSSKCSGTNGHIKSQISAMMHNDPTQRPNMKACIANFNKMKNDKLNRVIINLDNYIKEMEATIDNPLCCSFSFFSSVGLSANKGEKLSLAKNIRENLIQNRDKPVTEFDWNGFSEQINRFISKDRQANGIMSSSGRIRKELESLLPVQHKDIISRYDARFQHMLK